MSSRARGRRYDREPKLNLKKVFGVIIVFAVIVMMIITMVKILNNEETQNVQSKLEYFSIYENGKWGVIDSDGNSVIAATYDEMISIPDSEKAVFVCVYDIDDENGTYKTKVINEKNEEILTGYDSIEAIDNYDSKQNVWYEKNVLRVKKRRKIWNDRF